MHPDNSGMLNAPEISTDAIRSHILARAKAFAEPRKIALSAIAEAAVKDSKFLARVEAGENFTVKTYQRVLDWMDEQERAA